DRGAAGEFSPRREYIPLDLSDARRTGTAARHAGTGDSIAAERAGAEKGTGAAARDWLQRTPLRADGDCGKCVDAICRAGDGHGLRAAGGHPGIYHTGRAPAVCFDQLAAAGCIDHGVDGFLVRHYRGPARATASGTEGRVNFRLLITASSPSFALSGRDRSCGAAPRERA